MKEETIRLIKYATKMSLFVAVALAVLSTMNVVAMYAYCLLLILIICNPFRKQFGQKVSGMAICESTETIGDDMASISKIREKEWRKLRFNEKVAVCQNIVDIERRYLGIPYRIILHTDKLNDSISGCYSHNLKRITLKTRFVYKASGREILEVVLHEIYHSHQYCILDLYHALGDIDKNLFLFSKAKAYESEFNNYISAEDNNDRYQKQLVEIEANEYAIYRSREYYNRIFRHYRKNTYDHVHLYASYRAVQSIINRIKHSVNPESRISNYISGLHIV